MSPSEQLEHNAEMSVASSGEEFPFCLRCNVFTYLDYLDQCMRCGGRSIIWREIPVFAPKPKLVRGALLVAGLVLVALATAIYVLLVVR